MHLQSQGPRQKSQPFNNSGLNSWIVSLCDELQCIGASSEIQTQLFFKFAKESYAVRKIDYSGCMWAFICSQNKNKLGFLAG